MKLRKGNETITLENYDHAKAFMENGWEEVKEKDEKSKVKIEKK